MSCSGTGKNGRVVETGCPCGSGKGYGECCGRFHAGEAAAPTAEALMRSRYCRLRQGRHRLPADHLALFDQAPAARPRPQDPVDRSWRSSTPPAGRRSTPRGPCGSGPTTPSAGGPACWRSTARSRVRTVAGSMSPLSRPRPAPLPRRPARPVPRLGRRRRIPPRTSSVNRGARSSCSATAGARSPRPWRRTSRCRSPTPI